MEYLDGAVVGGLEKVPEGVRAYYEETEIDGEKVAIPRIKPVEIGGKHFAFEDVAGLKRTNLELKAEKTRVKGESDSAQSRIRELEESALETAQRLELLQKERKPAAENGDPQPKDPDTLERLAKIEESAKKKIGELTKQHETDMQAIREQLHFSTSVTAVDVSLADAKVKEEYKDLIRKEMLASVKTHNMDGRPVAVVVDEKGEARTSTKATSMDLMTPRELADEMRKKYPSCFQQIETATGTGSPSTLRAPSKSAIDTATPVASWGMEQKLKFIKENGPEAYENLVMANYKTPFA